MVKYYWGREDEAKLLELWRKGVTNVDVLAREFGRKPRAVEMKLKRLGVVAVKPSFLCTTTTERALLENTGIDGKMLNFLCYSGVKLAFLSQKKERFGARLLACQRRR